MTNFWDFNIGNLITIIGGIVALVIAVQKNKSDNDALKEDFNEVKKRLSNGEDEMKQLTKMGVINSIAQHERRITSLEYLISDIATLKTDIVWIKDNMRMRHTPPA